MLFNTYTLCSYTRLVVVKGTRAIFPAMLMFDHIISPIATNHRVDFTLKCRMLACETCGAITVAETDFVARGD